MENSVLINKRVKILAVYSDSDGLGVCMPKRMQYKNQEYNFSELGLKHPTAKGKRMIHVFDVSDGSADYRLEFDAEQLTWTLMYMVDGSHGN